MFQSSLEFARAQDATDTLRSYRNEFFFPEHNGHDAIYFCGNSLGLQPRNVSKYIQQELDDWAKFGVEGHFQAKNPWFSYHHFFTERLAALVGAQKDEVVVMNTLSVNVHLLMASFYRPSGKRTKIIMEAGAFPSDMYIVETQVRMHGLDPKEHIIEVAPRPGAYLIEDQDILDTIHATGDSLALVIWGGVNYYTGQYFDLRAITAAAHEVGAYAGFDLAHAAGNLPLELHNWDVDFAAWCSYKYLNSGPGAAGGVFVHERHGNNPSLLRLAGWWGNDEKTRFRMEKGFIPQQGAASWQMSNAPVFNMVAQLASLDIFSRAGLTALRSKSLTLTAYLHFLLMSLPEGKFEVITPAAPEKRGAQLSLLFNVKGREVFKALSEKGIIADWREPNVIRIAPAPLYNSFEDCYRFYEVLKSVLN